LTRRKAGNKPIHDFFRCSAVCGQFAAVDGQDLWSLRAFYSQGWRVHCPAGGLGKIEKILTHLEKKAASSGTGLLPEARAPPPVCVQRTGRQAGLFD